jgi:polyketide synthase 5
MRTTPIALAYLDDEAARATVGSEHCRQLLRDIGIEHVYDSRSPKFGESVRRAPTAMA